MDWSNAKPVGVKNKAKIRKIKFKNNIKKTNQFTTSFFYKFVCGFVILFKSFVWIEMYEFERRGKIGGERHKLKVRKMG